MEASKLISKAFNDSVKIDKSWFILALPFIINNLFGLVDNYSIISYVVSIFLLILELGIIYKIMLHVFEGNTGLLKPDFSIYNVELISQGIIAFVILLILFVSMIILYIIMGILTAYAASYVMYILYAIICLLILLLIVTISGFVLAHGINTNSFINGIINLPSIIKSVGIVNILIFILINIILSVVAAILMIFFALIPIIGPIIGSSIISAALVFYFVLASAYMYKQYVLENSNDFDENEYNIILGYPRKITTDTQDSNGN